MRDGREMCAATIRIGHSTGLAAPLVSLSTLSAAGLLVQSIEER
jgi:hypothetical protein